MKLRTVSVVVAGAMVAAYWHWSPYLAMRELRAAALAGDGDKAAEYVDFTRLQESLKAQLRLRAADAMSSSRPEGAASLGAALGAALGSAMVDRAIEAMVTPQTVRQMVARGGVKNGDGDGQGQGVKWAYERPSLGTVIAFPQQQADLSPQARDRFVFKRSGFADWKLTEIRMSGTH